MRGSVGARETWCDGFVRLSTWESKEKQRRSRKEEKRKENGAKCLQTLKPTHTRAHTRRQRYTYIPLASSFVRSFVRSSVRRPLWWWPGLAGPPSLGNPNHPTSRHVCSCFLASHVPILKFPLKSMPSFLSSFPWLLLVASIRPSVRPARPCRCSTL